MDIHVYPDGMVECAGRRFRASLGRGGVRADKREGDGATPVGAWPLRRVLYRPDRVTSFITKLPISAIGPDDGWCDDPGHAAYNRPVKLPFAASHEVMWRDDHLYDLVVVVGHNDDPPVPGAGSAIFMHLRPEDGGPTAGCIALALPDLTIMLAALSPESRLVVHPAE